LTDQANLIVAQCATILSQCLVAANEAATAAAATSGAAPLNSPAFVGLPTAPTQPLSTDNTTLATTQYVDRLGGAANGLATLDNTGHIPTGQLPSSVLGGLTYQGVWNASTNTPTLTSSVGVATYFYVVNVAGTTTLNGISSWSVGDWAVFSGTVWQRVPAPAITPTNVPLSSLAVQAAYTVVANNTGSSAAPTAITQTALTTLINAFAGDSGSGGTLGGVPAPAAGDAASNKVLGAGGGWVVPPTPSLAGYAMLASPTFTGAPLAPTQTADTSNTTLATTGFVIGQASSATPLIDGTAAVGTSLRYARGDHVHPTDTSRAPLASPALTGAPTAPTQTAADNSTKLATTAYVDGTYLTTAAAASTYLTSATAASTYLASATAASTYAPLASPALSGNPTAPTQSAGNNSTRLATTAYVATAVASVAGQPIPTSSSFAVGSFIANMGYTSTTHVADGSTTAGSNLRIGDNGVGIGGVTQSGTWKNVSGKTQFAAVNCCSQVLTAYGGWVRTA
jgi:hypothetical protein